MKKAKKEFQKLVVKAKRVVLTTHLSPDLDAICSLLAVYAYLKKNFPEKNVEMVVSDPLGFGEIDLLNFSKIQFLDEVLDRVGKDDLLICLDGNTFDRFSYEPAELKKKVDKSICIDHHPGAPDDFTLKVIGTDALATCVLVTELFFRDQNKLDKFIAETLMLGIMADSGTFDFVDPENAASLDTVKWLVEVADVSIRDLLQRYFKIGPKEFEVIQEFTKNTVNKKIMDLPGLTCSYLPRVIAKKFDTKIVHRAFKRFLYIFVRNIEGYPWGFVVIPTRTGFKMEFRSNPGAPDVRKIAEELGGGGHRYASGAGFIPKPDEKPIDSEEVCKVILKRLKS